MAQAQFYCTNKTCPDREDDEPVYWWTAILPTRVGTTDAVDEYCPSCGFPGEPTGEVEHD